MDQQAGDRFPTQKGAAPNSEMKAGSGQEPVVAEPSQERSSRIRFRDQALVAEPS